MRSCKALRKKLEKMPVAKRCVATRKVDGD